jgi:hypothetical protein
MRRPAGEDITVAPIRVILALGPTILQRLLRDLIEREEGVEVVDETDDPVDLLMAVRRTEANVVLIAWPKSGEMPGICTHLLLEFPELLVIGLPEKGADPVFCQLRINHQQREVAGLQGLFDEMRGALADEP